MSDDVKLTIGSQNLLGWERVSIKRSMEMLCSSFQLMLTDVWKDTDFELFPYLDCSIKIGDDLLLQGFIDDVTPDISADSETFSVSGRDKTGDLVDCSAPNIPASWNKEIQFEALIRELLSPFSIGLVVGTDLGLPVKKFSLNTGESPYEAIARLCEDRALLPMSTPEGKLILTETGSERSTDKLEYGVNVVAAKASYNAVNRFSSYTVKGQSSGGSESSPASNVFGEAEDPEVTRVRPKILLAEGQDTNKGAQDKAAWEAQIRAARAQKISVTVPDWRQSSGELWRENRLAYVKIPALRVDNDLLISEVVYKEDSQSRSADLQLVSPDTFSPAPSKVVKPARKKKAFQWQ